MEIGQYQVVLVNLAPTVGSEIRKTRPCVVISPVEMNKYLNTIVIAPLTTSKNNYPTRVKIKFKKRIGRVVLDQIRTIDKVRIIKTLGSLSHPEVLEIKKIISLTYVQ